MVNSKAVRTFTIDTKKKNSLPLVLSFMKRLESLADLAREDDHMRKFEKRNKVK